MRTRNQQFSDACRAYEQVAFATSSLPFAERNLALHAVAIAADLDHGFDRGIFTLSKKNGAYAGQALFCVFR